jgi:NADPH-dependent 7-cyano-7-deazaguanine reductase QueF
MEDCIERVYEDTKTWHTDAKISVHNDYYQEVGQSYKKEYQEKNPPHRLNTAHSCLGIQPHCLSVHF